jgi:uncharacterized membrane protein YccC
LLPWVFAAKTTASGLIALLVAFTFDLDQPQWALLSVFIVAQPQSGMVLAKSFYRVVGTLIGAAVALLFVGLFAQERVLFLGALALWIGASTFGSQYAKNFAAYSFVLSGYTAAIVGIPGALDPGNAFYIATARVTEISLGIIATAAISHLVLPSALAASLWQVVDGAHAALGEYAAALCRGRDTAAMRAKLLGQALAIENLRASAIFEDREIRDRSDYLRRVVAALINFVVAARFASLTLDQLRGTGEPTEAEIDEAIATAGVAVREWRAGAIGAVGLSRGLIRARARLPLIPQLCRDRSAEDAATIRWVAVVGRLREFFAALTAYAEAHETLVSAAPPPASRPIGFTHANDPIGALWTGLRAALAILLVGWFWILVDWEHGPTAAILAAVATARLATMGPAVPIALGATLIFAVSSIPAFIVVEVLLPLASGFPAFCLVVAPMLFLCAFLMARKETMLIGFMSALLFASAGQFQNEMAYDPVGFVNTCIAAIFAAATAMVLWAIVAPATPEAARRRFVRVAGKALARIAAPRPRVGLAEFDTAMTEVLGQLQSTLHLDRPGDLAQFEAGLAVLGAGRALIRLRQEHASPATAAVEEDVARLAADRPPDWLDRTRRLADNAAAGCLAELREGGLGAGQAQAAARRIIAFTALPHDLERSKALLTDRHRGARSDAA